MEKREFFELLLDTLNLTETEANMDTTFDSYDFDSFAKLSIVMLIDTCMNKTISPVELVACKTLGDIVDLAFTNG
ncbi:MAG: acyl carrier protein [Firmicutes bacterium]|nr:acyl carrier protein [Bacillota bacterium]